MSAVPRGAARSYIEPTRAASHSGAGPGPGPDAYPRGGAVSPAWFRRLTETRGFVALGGEPGRSSRVFRVDDEVMKVQYLVQQPHEGPAWLTMQLFGYREDHAEAPDAEALALLVGGEALTDEQIDSLRPFAAACWIEEVEAMQRGADAGVTPAFLGHFFVEDPRMPGIRLGVTLQRRAAVVWGQYDDAELARRACRTGLKPLVRIVTDTARAGLCHPDLNVGNICEHRGRVMLLDWADALPEMPGAVFTAGGAESRDAVTEEWRVLMMLRSLMKQFGWIEKYHPCMTPRLHTQLVTLYIRRRRDFMRRLRCVTDPHHTDYENVFYSAYD